MGVWGKKGRTRSRQQNFDCKALVLYIDCTLQHNIFFPHGIYGITGTPPPSFCIFWPGGGAGGGERTLWVERQKVVEAT